MVYNSRIMSDYIWRGSPYVEASIEQSYHNLTRPLLSVRDIARLAGVAGNAVKYRTLHEGKTIFNNASLYTGKRNGDHGQIEAKTSAARKLFSILETRLYSGELHVSTHGPTLFALAIYGEKTPQPPVLYSGMSASSSLALRVRPEKKPDDSLLTEIGQFIAEHQSANPQTSVRVSTEHDDDTFTLRYQGKTADIAAHQHDFFDEFFGATVAFDSNLNLFGAPVKNIQEVSQEALEKPTPFEAAQHIQRVFVRPQNMPNASLLEFWGRQ